MISMDIIKTIRELGPLTTCGNLSTVLYSDDVKEKAGAVMPLPDVNIKDCMPDIAKWLAGFNKSHYLFTSPEIELIEILSDNIKKATILVPDDLDSEIKTRLEGNLPNGTNVELLKEPYFPTDLFPRNGIMVVCGYESGNRLKVLRETARMIERYNFPGRTVFISYVSSSPAIRYDDWTDVSNYKFNEIWRPY